MGLLGLAKIPFTEAAKDSPKNIFKRILATVALLLTSCENLQTEYNQNDFASPEKAAIANLDVSPLELQTDFFCSPNDLIRSPNEIPGSVIVEMPSGGCYATRQDPKERILEITWKVRKSKNRDTNSASVIITSLLDDNEQIEVIITFGEDKHFPRKIIMKGQKTAEIDESISNSTKVSPKVAEKITEIGF